MFDAEGRVNPALLTVVYPSRAVSLETHPVSLRRRRIAGSVLILFGPLSIVFAYVERYGIGRSDIELIFPAITGINLMLLGARLCWITLIVGETERAREAHVADRSRPSRRRAP